jgi:hypothetical protein
VKTVWNELFFVWSSLVPASRGTFGDFVRLVGRRAKEVVMNGLIYLIGLIVVILAILSFFGLR